MKITTLLCSLLLFTNLLSAKVFSKDAANPIMPTLSNLSVCDTNNDGIALFNLTLQTPIILAAQSGASSNYSVNYYLTQIDAITGSNAIGNPSNYMNMTNQQTVYARVVNNGTTQYAIGPFSLIANPTVIPVFSTISPICQGDTPPVLPSTSSNGISGMWTPSTINTTVSGATTITFTPDSGQCAVSTTITSLVYPKPTVQTPSDFSHCDDIGANDGYYPYNLSALIPTILGSQSASNFTVRFYDNQMSAENNVNTILDLINYQTYTHTIWIRVTNNASGCYAISHFNTTIEQAPTPLITSNSNIICVNYSTNNILTNTTLSASNSTFYLTQSSPYYSYQWLDATGTPITGATNYNYNINSPFPNSNSDSFLVRMTSTSALGCSSTSPIFQVNQSGPASPIGIGYSIVNNAGNQTITVEVEGYGVYQYSLDGGTTQASPIFQNCSLGNHTISVTDLNGCGSLVLNNVNVNLTATPPPTGNTLQSFGQGATLANMQVTGQNIQWYSGSNKMASSAPLPLSTVLVNGTTYYASQKIGGYESISRLPVTAQVVLNTAQFELKGLTYAPNPVTTNLNIKCNEILDEVTVYNLLGQLVNQTKVFNSDVQVDLSSLKSGNYFVRVSSGSSSSTFKMIKE